MEQLATPLMRHKGNSFSNVSVEEQFFNNATLKVVNGEKRLCGHFYFTETFRDCCVDAYVDNRAAIAKEVFKRIIGEGNSFTRFKSGKTAVKHFTNQFKQELKNCINRNSVTGSMLCSGEINRIYCQVVSYSEDKSTFEGTHDLEIYWYAEVIRNGEVVTRPILHGYNSKNPHGTRH